MKIRFKPRRLALWSCIPVTMLSGLILFGRTDAIPYHLEKPVETLDTPLKGKVQMGYVEVDDMGELQDFRQLAAVTKEIKEESKKAKGLRVILFVHGWNNNAEPGSASLESFKKVLMSLQDAQDEDGGGKIFGVFIGWRGQTMKMGSMYLDFFHRYQGGHRAGTGAGTDAIYEVAATAKKANEKNVVILCGHSFGGMLLEDAISQPTRARLAEAHAKGTNTLDSRDIMPADMVILINEAQHAVKARQLVSALRDRQVGVGDKDLPWIVSITSQTDVDTGSRFPFGVTLGRWLPPLNLFDTTVSGEYRKDETAPNAGSQSEAASHTAGHFQPLHSHVVTYIDKILPEKRLNSKLIVLKEQALLWHIMVNLKPRQHDQSIIFHCSEGNYKIERVPQEGAFNTTPYWIMSVPKEIIANHTDIWTPQATGLVTALIHLRIEEAVKVTPSAPPTPKPADNHQTTPLQLQLAPL